MLQTLHIHLLGDFRLVHGEQPLTSVDSPRVQSLLAHLLLHRDAPQSRQRLAFLLWPDSSEAQARTNLRNLLHLLRQALPDADHFLYADTQTLQWRLDTPFTLDVAAFEQSATQASSAAALREAVDLYRGDLLPSCYEDWILPERERLRQMFMEALEKLIRLFENQRDYHAAIQYTQLLLRQDSLREETYRQLMRLYALSGDPTGVLRVYQTCATVLKRELDAEVSPATRAAYEQLLKMEIAPARPADVPPRPRLHNLPIQLTSFIGREREIAEVRQLLSTSRLLTLTGAGGCGKTRLALQVASELSGRDDAASRDDSTSRLYKDGVWLVELASLSDPALVPQAVAAVLDVREQQGHTLTQTCMDYLQAKALLLILDNCEHLLTACAQLAEALLRACPHVQILATSRERLNIAGEAVWLVPALSLPAPEQVAHLAELNQSEAVRLLVERAALALPTFTLNQQNAAAVAQVCQHLDGIPLAIELAAARVKMLTVEQIAERLDDRFRLLVGGSRTVLPKHQTLQATMDWSYQLLSEPERVLFRRLSVFAGGFSLKTAEAVGSNKDEGGKMKDELHPSSFILHPSEVLELLAQLVDKSLVMVDTLRQANAEVRYRLLETIRQYSREKLEASGETEWASARHLSFFLQFAEEAESKFRGAEQVEWVNQLETEHDNLRRALAWALGQNEAESALRLSGALWRFWEVRGYLVEGREWLERTLANNSERSVTKAKALDGASNIALNQSDPMLARSLAEESLALWRELGDKRGLAQSLNALGYLTSLQGDHMAARSLAEESLALNRELSAPRGIAHALETLGYVAMEQGDHLAARSLAEESLTLFRGLGDKGGISDSLYLLGQVAENQADYQGAASHFERSFVLAEELGDKNASAGLLENLGDMAWCQDNYEQAASFYYKSLTLNRELGNTYKQDILRHNLGYAALHQGSHEHAAALFKESLAHFRAQGRKRWVAFSLTGLAGVAVAQAQPIRTALLLGAVEILLEAHNYPQPPVYHIEHDRSLAALRTQLDDATFHEAWAEGRAMTMEQVIEYALKDDSA